MKFVTKDTCQVLRTKSAKIWKVRVWITASASPVYWHKYILKDQRSNDPQRICNMFPIVLYLYMNSQHLMQATGQKQQFLIYILQYPTSSHNLEILIIPRDRDLMGYLRCLWNYYAKYMYTPVQILFYRCVVDDFFPVIWKRE